MSNIPNHIAIIMDGNRRWAKLNKKKLLMGHDFAANFTIEKIVEHAARRGVKYITLWAFSTENWQRNKQEVEGLLRILRKAVVQKVPSFIKKGVKLLVIGDLSRFPQDLQNSIKEAIEKTRDGKNITAIVALNYGGRDEILRAINKWSLDDRLWSLDGKATSDQRQTTKDKRPTVSVKKLKEKDFSNYLDTKGIPDPDLLIRTGGEKRLSGFLPWQSVYTELYFTDVLWPDFSEKDLDEAIADYQQRIRRFGR